MFSPVYVRSTLIGEKVFPSGKTEGFERINIATLSTLQESRFAAVGQPLRLAGSPLPLYRADAAIQRKTLCVRFSANCKARYYPWDMKTLQRFRLLTIKHGYIVHRATCLYRRRCDDSEEDIRR